MGAVELQRRHARPRAPCTGRTTKGGTCRGQPGSSSERSVAAPRCTGRRGEGEGNPSLIPCWRVKMGRKAAQRLQENDYNYIV
jgi:hypothetical protein